MKKTTPITHKLTAVLLALCLLMSVVFAQSLSAGALSWTVPGDIPNHDLPIDDDEYYDDSHLFISTWQYGADILGDGTLSLEQDRRGYKGYGQYEVPYSIEGYNVTVIGDYCYTGNTELTDLVMKSNIKKIGKYSFSGCTSLENIYIPASVTEIGDNAFNGCDNVVLNVGAGSAAEAYAIEHNLNYNNLNINDCDISIIFPSNSYSAYVSIVKRPENLYLENDVDYTTDFELDPDTMIGTVTIKGIGVFTGTYTESDQFYPMDDPLYNINAFNIDLDKTSYSYDGSEKKPSVSVYSICYPEDILPPNIDVLGSVMPNRSDDLAATGDGEPTYNYLTEGADYTVSYENNVNIGTAVVTIKGKGAYCGTATRTFTISEGAIDDAVVSIPQDAYTFTGSAIEPVVTVTDGGKKLGKDEDYTVSYQNNIYAGNAAVTVNGIGNYSGSRSIGFTIQKKDISDLQASLSGNEFSYTGSAICPDVVMSYNGISLEKNKDFTLSYSNNVTAGTGTVTVTGTGNYTGSLSLDFSIKNNTKAISECEIKLDKETYTYDGTEKRPTVTVTDNSEQLVLNTDYTVSYDSNINAGYATVSVKGKGRFTGETVKSFRINPKTIVNSGIFRQKDKTYTYNGTEQPYEFDMIDGGYTLVEGTDYEVSCTNCLNAGTAKAVIKGLGNYDGTITANYTINTLSLNSATVTASPNQYLYDGEPKEPDVIVTLNGVKLRRGTDFTVAYSDNTEVGTATAGITGIGNYSGSRSVPFGIAAVSAADLKIELSENSYTYDGNEHKPSVTVTYNDEALVKGTDYTLNYSNYVNAGDAMVTITCKGHYTGVSKVSYMISPAHISSADITLSPDSFTYDGEAKTPAVTAVFNGKTLSEGKDYTVSYDSNTFIGTAKAIVKGEGNFFGESSAPFEIVGPSYGEFEWGADNWNFDNSGQYFSDYYYINDDIKKKFKSDYGVSNKDMESIESEMDLDNSQYGGFQGSCYGMTTTEMMAKYGYLDLTRYGADKTVNKNTNTSDVISLINCFQYTQGISSFNSEFRRRAFNPSSYARQSDFISTLENELSSGNRMINICFQIRALVMVEYNDANNNLHEKNTFEPYGGHSVLAYGIESGNYHRDETDMDYDRRILIADPNALSLNYAYDDCCLYYRTSDHSWIIPFYTFYEDGPLLTLCFWNASSELSINTGFINDLFDYDSKARPKSVMNTDEADHYLSGLTITNSDGAECDVEQIKTGSNPHMMNAGGDDKTGVAKYTPFTISKEMDPQTNREDFALWNPTASYIASYDNMTDFSLMMDYENVSYYADLSNADLTTFAASGYISAQGDDTDYEISMVTNDDLCVTDWYKLTASGSGVDDVSLRRVRGGYVLKATNLDNVTISVKNDTDTASCTFSTDYDSVFIHEIDENTIGVNVDTDNNGTYETGLFGDAPEEPTEEPTQDPNAPILGDVDGDKEISSNDPTFLLRALVEYEVPDRVTENKMNGDIDGNNRLEAPDATFLQRYLVNYYVPYDIGKPIIR